MDLNNVLLEQLIAVMPGNVYWKNRDGVYLGCNENLVKTFGLKSSREFIGKKTYDLVDKNDADKIYVVDEKVMSTNQEVMLEEIYAPSGVEPMIFLTKKIPLVNENNSVVGLLGVSFDITERKKMEKALEESNKSKAEFINRMHYLEELIVLMPGNVYWKNREGVYLGSNQNNVDNLGLKAPKDLIGKKIHAILNKKLADQVTADDEKIMASDKELIYEEPGINSKNEKALFFTKKLPLHDDQGKVVGLLGVSIDITERKKMEEQLLAAKEIAENANRAKTEFLSNLAKDFRLALKGLKSPKKSAVELKKISEDLENMAIDVEGFAHFNLNAEAQEIAIEDMPITLPKEKINELHKAHKYLGLSKRESECIHYLVRGMTLKLVAKKMGLSPRTVEFYVDNAKDKLGCVSKSELIAKIFSENLV